MRNTKQYETLHHWSSNAEFCFLWSTQMPTICLDPVIAACSAIFWMYPYLHIFCHVQHFCWKKLIMQITSRHQTQKNKCSWLLLLGDSGWYAKVHSHIYTVGLSIWRVSFVHWSVGNADGAWLYIRYGTSFTLKCAKLIKCNNLLKHRITRSAFCSFCMCGWGREREKHTCYFIRLVMPTSYNYSCNSMCSSFSIAV